MKSFFENVFRNFIGNPVLLTLVIGCSVFIAFCTADTKAPPEDDSPDYEIISVPVELIESTTTTTVTTTGTTSTTTSTTSTTDTTATTDTETTTDVTTTTSGSTSVNEGGDHGTTGGTSAEPSGSPYEPPQYVYEYINAGDSPNSSYYQDRLVIIGDSIAYGFNAYGYIPGAHNIAKESLAVWNMDRYTFDVGGGQMGVYDAAGYVNSPLYFISIGMNDIFTYTPDDYAWKMCDIALEVLDRVPDATVVIGAITPVSANNYYTDNSRIQDFNYALEYAVSAYDTSQILFFNTYACLADPDTGALAYGYGGGDGLHLNGSTYGYVLSCLFNYLDTTNAIDQIEAHDNNY